MLKEYAVALVLSTTTPVAADKQEGAKPASDSQKETVTQPQTMRPKTGAGWGGVGGRPQAKNSYRKRAKLSFFSSAFQQPPIRGYKSLGGDIKVIKAYCIAPMNMSRYREHRE